jgi:hypothetical protein
MWHVWETGEVHTGVWYEDLMERNHLEDLAVDGDSIKIVFKMWDGGEWTELIWPRTGTGDGHL